MFLLGFRRIYAQYVNSFGGVKLESREYCDFAISSRFTECGYTAHIVMVCDGEHRNANCVGFLDYGFDVGLSANTRSLTLESIEVVSWVHLEGATMKHRTG